MERDGEREKKKREGGREGNLRVRKGGLTPSCGLSVLVLVLVVFYDGR
jgi:hypothetical protein